MPDSSQTAPPYCMEFETHSAIREASGSEDVAISICTDFWQHVLKEHIKNERRKPWESVFGRQVIEEMMVSSDDNVLEHSVVQKLNKKIEQEMAHGLLLPLVLVSERAEGTKRSTTGWQIITPQGLCVIVQTRHEQMSCTTAYFNNGHGLAEPNGAARCREMVRKVVRQYARPMIADNYLLPDQYFVQSHHDTKGGGEVKNRQIRFLTPATWGFAADRPESPWALPTHFFEQKN